MTEFLASSALFAVALTFFAYELKLFFVLVFDVVT